MVHFHVSESFTFCPKGCFISSKFQMYSLLISLVLAGSGSSGNLVRASLIMSLIISSSLVPSLSMVTSMRRNFPFGNITKMFVFIDIFLVCIIG